MSRISTGPLRGVAKTETPQQRLKVIDHLLARYQGDPSIYPSTIDSLLMSRSKLLKELDKEAAAND